VLCTLAAETTLMKVLAVGLAAAYMLLALETLHGFCGNRDVGDSG
jgi:hypothetical protein